MIKEILKSMFSNLSNWVIVVFVTILTIPLCNIFGRMGFGIINGFITSILFAVLSYQTAWKRGWKDVNYLKINNIKFTPIKGFLMPLIPYIIMLALFIIFKFTSNSAVYFGFFFTSMYNGFISIFPNAYIYAYLPVMIITCIVTGVAYMLGYKRYSLSINLMYKKDKEENN